MSFISPDPQGSGEVVRRMVPAGTVFLAILFMALPLPLAWGVMPNFALLFVIIWASLQPRLMPAWAAFGLGLLADLVFGDPLGIWALLYAASVVAVRLAEARVEGHSLIVDWSFAAVLLVLAHILCWQLLHFTGSDAPLTPLLVQAGVSLLAYPLAAAAAARIQRRLVDVGG